MNTNTLLLNFFATIFILVITMRSGRASSFALSAGDPVYAAITAGSTCANLCNIKLTQSPTPKSPTLKSPTPKSPTPKSPIPKSPTKANSSSHNKPRKNKSHDIKDTPCICQ